MTTLSEIGFDNELLNASILRVGEVIEVRGRTIKILVDKVKNGAILNYKGKSIKNVSVGSYVTIKKGFSKIVGVVEGEYISNDKQFNQVYSRKSDASVRILEVSVIGYFDLEKFQNGVKELPMIGSPCSLTSQEEIERTIYQEEGDSIPVGRLSSNPDQAVSINPNRVLASHIGIFGNTGSGKSYTLAKIYSEVFNRYGANHGFTDSSRFILIDFNGEYSGSGIIAPDSLKRSYCLSTKKLSNYQKIPLPKTVLHDAQIWRIFLDATEKTQSPFLSRVFRKKLVRDLLNGRADITDTVIQIIHDSTTSFDKTMDKNICQNFLHELSNYVAPQSRDLVRKMEEKASGLYFNSTTSNYYLVDPYDPSKRVYPQDPMWVSKLDALFALKNERIFCQEDDLRTLGAAIVICYYDECIRGYSNAEHLAPLLKRLNSRIDDLNKVIKLSDTSFYDKTLTVISLRDVNLEIRKVLPMLISSYIYSKAKDGTDFCYLNLIIDEAHNILSNESSRESEQWKSYRLETFEEIIKEGRKYGVFLTVASQRPFDISPTIISQLHNYFLHRLVNERDLTAIENAVSYIDKLSFDSIPVLATGSCIVSGTAFNRPLLVDVSEIRGSLPPASETVKVESLWQQRWRM